MGRIQVAVRDHRRLVREGLCMLLNDQPHIDAREFVDGDESAVDLTIVTNATDGQVAAPDTRVVTFHDASSLDEIIAAVSLDAPHPEVRASTGATSAPAALEPSCTLTAREAEILECIAAGLSASEVSEQLGISRKTVEGHKRRIFTKLDVQNQAHAVAIATRAGMLQGGR